MSDTPSPAQARWIRLARVIHARLMEKADDLPAMTPEEATQYVEACREALRLELDARGFDHMHDLEQSKTPFS